MAEQTDQNPPQATTLGMRDVLKIRNFRWLWLGQVVSNFGDSLTALALIFLVNNLTGSTAAIAIMAIVLAVPQVVFGLIAGVYVDRMDRKRIMIMSDLLRGILVLGLMFIDSKDQLWLLYIIAFAQASVGTFFTPARSAIIPNLVPANGLMTANGLSQITAVMVRVLGVGASGVLVGVFDVFWPAFAIDSATFFISLIFIAQITLTQIPSSDPSVLASAKSDKKGIKAVWNELKGGILVIFKTRVLLGSLVAAAVAMFGLGAVNVLLVPLIVNDLAVEETWFGALEFSQAFSMIASGTIVAYLATRFKPTRIISFGMVGIGIAVAFIAAVSHVWQLMLILFTIGWFLTPLQASIATLMQTAVPDQLRGRTGAALGTLIQTANLFSMALAGIFGDVLGTRVTFALGGLVVVLSGVMSAMVFGDIGKISGLSSRLQDEHPPEIDSGDLQPQIGSSV